MIVSVSIFEFIILVAACYLIGSINWSILVSRVVFKTDIRTLGSGNAGSTNVLRSFGKKAAIPVFILDVVKGVFGYLVGMLAPGGNVTLAMICAFAAIAGHVFPIYYGFRGGKGVATTFGVCLVAAPLATLITMVVVVIIFAIGKRISLGSLIGILLFTILAFAMSYPTAIAAFGVVMTLLIWIKHRGNIVRLLKGEEPKFSLKK